MDQWPPPSREAQIIEALRPVQDPELHRSIVDLGMLRGVDIRPDGVVDVLIAPHGRRLPAAQRDPAPRVRRGDRHSTASTRVDLDFTVMTDGSARNCARGCTATRGDRRPEHRPTATPRAAAIPFAETGSKTRPLLISSGKGGVGKSSVTVNLAVALAQQGHSVGIVDADIYGYSIPRMLGADRDPSSSTRCSFRPKPGACAASRSATSCPEGQAVIWRGPMLHKALEQFLTDVYWDEPDFLLIDMPPGTGDIALRLSQYLPRGEVYVVTTPQPAAQKVARVVGGDGGQGQPAGEGRDREHVVVHRRRRQALRDLRRRRRSGSSPTSSVSRCSASCRWCPNSARAATTACRSPPSIPTARRAGRSTRSPGRSPST